MQFFENDGLKLAFLDEGEGEPILLIHGFASSSFYNWVQPGWIQTLTAAGYRAIAIDNRGHGNSDKPHDRSLYTPTLMAGDAAALLDHLDIPQAHVMGYSMGARISAFLALNHPERVHDLIFGGLGIGMVEGAGDWSPIAEALLADDPDSVSHPRGKMFRMFADKTQSDKVALAACVITSKEEISEANMARITQPTLVGVGTKDDIGGDPHRLAALMPRGEAIDIPNRDHMLAVGDKVFKQAVIEFLKRNPL
ncbi:Pimeloyl-ACP methyl ester carboxylesterase [Phyllobacterium sp. YR620]|uniref:Alpha/beta hydrolase n=1 Tax=Phyllobacterium pellucidum TaxID=2740464 RepID=A0A849VIQ7_9HYPH|nr:MULTISPECIES: alpha/beta hydrolase [Phyllobacterium]NTS29728.1 alpha/beta hydrolase [Phyllobacterium pellucidum]SDP61512.1 Pimeloyl-ACP methyl ester carboxylesterase [Phyllobacterium sp. YR620]SFJ11363.1 Pimeloyl-ACP methyl ester carboxylesterase [Phyllobacterium sp. CL33Tsu]